MPSVPVVLPEPCLVALAGVAGSGKSTFAARHFLPTEVLSSDAFRRLVADDESDQSATAAAFDALYAVAGLRLARGRLTVVDATNVQTQFRMNLVALARHHDVAAVAIVLDLPHALCAERNRARSGRAVSARMLRDQVGELQRSTGLLAGEGFHHVYVLTSVDEVDAVHVTRQPRS